MYMCIMWIYVRKGIWLNVKEKKGREIEGGKVYVEERMF